MKQISGCAAKTNREYFPKQTPNGGWMPSENWIHLATLIRSWANAEASAQLRINVVQCIYW